MLYFLKRGFVNTSLGIIVTIAFFNCNLSAGDTYSTCDNVIGETEKLYSDIQKNCFKEGLIKELLDVDACMLNNLIEKEKQLEIEEEIRLGEMELLAQLVEAEAGNQDLTGKKLVCDVVLNRVDSQRFPDTIEEVIFQEGQFSCVNSGGFDKAGWDISDESFKAVISEYDNTRKDSDILFFTAGKHNYYCIPGYKYGDHYFGY